MTYNYVIATGDSTITGSQLNISHKNQFPSFSANLFKTHFRLDENGEKKDYPFVFDTSIITGSGVSLVSFNSQTMLEATGVTISTTPNQNYYIQAANDLGNYIVDLDNSEGEIMFDPILNLNNQDVIYYDKKDFSSPFSRAKTSTSVGSWSTELDNIHSDIDDGPISSSKAELEENYFLFFNGQKLKDFSSNTELDSATGVIFAIQKQDNTDEITGVADSYGPKFIENHIDFYINGMEQTPEDFLQIHTGVYMIESGVDSSVYLVNKQTLSY